MRPAIALTLAVAALVAIAWIQMHVTTPGGAPAPPGRPCSDERLTYLARHDREQMRREFRDCMRQITDPGAAPIARP